MSVFGSERVWPRAHRYEIHYCGHCANAHVIYFDEEGIVICEATHSLEQVEALSASIEAHNQGSEPYNMAQHLKKVPKAD